VRQDERERLTTIVARQRERAEIREAIAAGAVVETIGRKLGDELISASRETISAWRIRDDPKQIHPGSRRWVEVDLPRIEQAIRKLEELVGRP
jgi:hypothetical protein